MERTKPSEPKRRRWRGARPGSSSRRRRRSTMASGTQTTRPRATAARSRRRQPERSHGPTLAATDPAVASYAAEHWLGAYRGLERSLPGYAASREDYHRLAYAVVSNARKQATGKFGLRYTRGGFGTPFFGNDEQVRVEGIS